MLEALTNPVNHSIETFRHAADARQESKLPGLSQRLADGLTRAALERMDDSRLLETFVRVRSLDGDFIASHFPKHPGAGPDRQIDTNYLVHGNLSRAGEQVMRYVLVDRPQLIDLLQSQDSEDKTDLFLDLYHCYLNEVINPQPAIRAQTGLRLLSAALDSLPESGMTDKQLRNMDRIIDESAPIAVLAGERKTLPDWAVGHIIEACTGIPSWNYRGEHIADFFLHRLDSDHWLGNVRRMLRLSSPYQSDIERYYSSGSDDRLVGYVERTVHWPATQAFKLFSRVHFLKTYRPDSLRILRENFNHYRFDRYPLPILVRQADDFQAGVRSGMNFAVFATDDHNNALLHNESEFEALLDVPDTHTAIVELNDAPAAGDLFRKLRNSYSRIRNIALVMHGCADYAIAGNTADGPDALLSADAITPEIMAEIEPLLAERVNIFLVMCSGGSQRAGGRMGFAERIAHAFRNSEKHIYVTAADTGKPDLGCSLKDITYNRQTDDFSVTYNDARTVTFYNKSYR